MSRDPRPTWLIGLPLDELTDPGSVLSSTSSVPRQKKSLLQLNLSGPFPLPLPGLTHISFLRHRILNLGALSRSRAKRSSHHVPETSLSRQSPAGGQPLHWFTCSLRPSSASLLGQTSCFSTGSPVIRIRLKCEFCSVSDRLLQVLERWNSHGEGHFLQGRVSQATTPMPRGSRTP